MYDDDPVGVALRDAHPPVDGDVVWPEVLRRIRRGRRVRRGTASLMAIALVVSVVGLVVNRGDDSSQTIKTAVDSPPTVTVSGGVALPIGQRPNVVALGGGSVWVVTGTTGPNSFPRDAGTLVRVDPATGSVVATIALQGSPAQVAVDESTAWVSLFNASAVARIDLATNTVTATIPLVLPRSVCSNDCPGGKDFLPFDIAVDSSSVWVSTARGYVARIDKNRNTVVAMIATAPDQTQGLAVTKDAVFVGQGNIGRIDTATNSLSSYASPVDRDHGFANDGPVEDIYASKDHPELGLWLTAYQNGQRASIGTGIIGIDLKTGKAITAHIESGVSMVTVTDRVWARRSGEFFAFDPATGTTGPAFPVPDDAIIAIDNNNVWVIPPGSTDLIGTTLTAPHASRRIRIVTSASPTANTTVPNTTRSLGDPTRCVGAGDRLVKVPDATGRPLRDAINMIRDAGLDVVDNGVPAGDPTTDNATVRSQEPPAGIQVPIGACVGFRTAP